MQQVKATDRLGKKIRYSAVVKIKHVKKWAGLWVRIDNEDKQYTWFDNMEDRPIKGTLGWERFNITFEVPNDSAVLNFGVLLVGPGRVWINGIEFTELDKDDRVLDRKLSIGQSLQDLKAIAESAL